MEVPRQTTGLTARGMVGPFVRGHVLVAGLPPAEVFLENILAIVGLENAGGAALNNHNWGNIMAGSGWRAAHDYWPHPQPVSGQPTHFRAYSDHVQGAADFWRHIYKRPSVLAAALRDDLPGMVRALYDTRYVVASSPGEAERYTAGAQRYRDEYRGLFRGVRTRESKARLAWLGLGILAGAGGVLLERKWKQR